MGLYKNKAIFDTADLDDSDQIGAHILGSGDNKVGSSTLTVGEALLVDIVGFNGANPQLEDDALAEASAGFVILAQRQDTLASSTSADGDAGYFKQNNLGELYVHDTSLLAEAVSIDDRLAGVIESFDSAQAGTTGFMIAGIRQDAGGSPVSADGDVHPFIFNNDGELKVAADLTSSIADDDADANNPVKIGGRAFDGALTALSASNDRYDLLGDMYRRTWVNNAPNISNKRTLETVGATAAELVATPLAGRIRIILQNQSANPIWFGEDATITTSGATVGFKIEKGETLELPWGEDLNIYAIAGGAGNNLLVWEIA